MPFSLGLEFFAKFGFEQVRLLVDDVDAEIERRANGIGVTASAAFPPVASDGGDALVQIRFCAQFDPIVVAKVVVILGG